VAVVVAQTGSCPGARAFPPNSIQYTTREGKRKVRINDAADIHDINEKAEAGRGRRGPILASAFSTTQIRARPNDPRRRLPVRADREP
jgi:hypothetical protein